MGYFEGLFVSAKDKKNYNKIIFRYSSYVCYVIARNEATTFGISSQIASVSVIS